MTQTKEDISPNYDYLHINTMVNKSGEIHLGMLPFITPFELVNETIDGKEVTFLVYEDVNVNDNTIRPVMAYEICNNTCLLYTSPSPRDRTRSRMPSSA